MYCVDYLNLLHSIELLYNRQLMIQQNFSEINNRVNTIFCFLCGRQFGTRGFVFHHRECKVKFQNEQKLRQPLQRTKMPESPEGITSILQGKLHLVDLKKFNMKSSEIYKYKVLPSCKYCGRTFKFQSLLVHMRGCDKQKTYKEEKENTVDINFKTPKTLVCCVCGQRFGTFSLKIHYPQCTKKFNDDEFRKHKKQEDRRQAPQFSKEDQEFIKNKIQWSDQEIEEFNKRAMHNYREKGMVECSNCQRKFVDQQLSKHVKNCTLINGVLNVDIKLEKKVSEKRKPRIVMCLICGRQFGTASIKIHIPNCEDLFIKQQNLKNKSERRKKPCLPQEFQEEFSLVDIEDWNSQKLQKYNKIVGNIYNTKSLSKCYICNRTFFEQSLAKHKKQCQTKIMDMKKLQKFRVQIKKKQQNYGQNFIQNIIQMNKKANKISEKNQRKPKTLMCYLCGRQYGQSSLKIHLPQCKKKLNHAKKMSEANFISIVMALENKYQIQKAEQWSEDIIEKYNKEVYQIYKKQSLFQCKFCHRTFFEQSLKKHIKHCQKQSESSQKRGRIKRTQTMIELSDKKQQDIPEIQQRDSRSQIDISDHQSLERLDKFIDSDSQSQIDRLNQSFSSITADLSTPKIELVIDNI